MVRPEWILGWNNGQAAPTNYSCCVTYPAGATLADVIDTVDAAIIARGWTLLDAAAGVNTRAYTAPNLLDATGAASVKNVILGYGTTSVIPTVYESWNAVTHVGTNLSAYSTNSGTAQVLDLTVGGQLNIAISPRYLILFSYTSSNGYGNNGTHGPSGVAELTRPYPEDTVALGYPKFGFFSDWYMQYPSAQMAFSIPRNRAGSAAGAITSRINSKFGSGYPSSALSVMPAGYDARTNKPCVSGLVVHGANTTTANTEVCGELIGVLGVSRNTGRPIGDDITVKLSPVAEYGNEKFLDEHGAVESWWLFGQAGNAYARWAVRK